MLNYYKIIADDTFIGVGSTYDLRKYQSKHNVIVTSDDNSAQYIQHDEKLYRDSWLAPLSTDSIEYEIVSIITIDKEEYDELVQAIESGEDIPTEQEPEPVIEEETIQPDPNEVTTVAYVKKMKIKEMSSLCGQTISNGIDIVLSDGETHHFSLGTNDQLNLLTLSSLVANGETQIPYHADGELCRYFSPEDIILLVNTATAFKTYHTTYFNSLREYINSMRSISKINAVSYGVSIPLKYQSDILKDLMEGEKS